MHKLQSFLDLFLNLTQHLCLFINALNFQKLHNFEESSLTWPISMQFLIIETSQIPGKQKSAKTVMTWFKVHTKTP
jgi:hypothetical protein